jgi:hypothetical protein
MKKILVVHNLKLQLVMLLFNPKRMAPPFEEVQLVKLQFSMLELTEFAIA